MATPPPTSTASCATPPPERFGLAGPSRPLDPRTHAYRGDLADIALAGRRLAPRYARPHACRCVASGVMVHGAPDAASEAVSQLLRGEAFHLLDQADGWAWGFCGHDHHVGYVPREALGAGAPPTHRVAVPLALAFAEPTIKASVVARLPIGALLAGEDAGAFLRTADGHVHHRHLARLDDEAEDAAAVAERLIGLPYRWGGRGDGGIDCSGLVQQALAFAGIPAPRDSDQQQAALGRALADDEAAKRGDLVFLPGHVGIMADARRLIHANAWWMAVTVEPLADVLARQPEGTEPVRRRIE